jgi:hypothetical protein
VHWVNFLRATWQYVSTVDHIDICGLLTALQRVLSYLVRSLFASAELDSSTLLWLALKQTSSSYWIVSAFNNTEFQIYGRESV